MAVGAAERDRRAASDRDLLQRARGSIEEADPLAVRRDERRNRRAEPGERRGVELIERAHEERRAVGADVDETRAIRREGKVAQNSLTVSAAALGGVIRKRDTRGGGMVARVANQTAMPAIATPMSHVPEGIAMRRHSGGRGAIVAELTRRGRDLAGSSRTNSATAMSAMRCRRSFARHRRSSVRTAAGTSAGSAAQSGSRAQYRRERVAHCPRRQTRVRPVSIS